MTDPYEELVSVREQMQEAAERGDIVQVEKLLVQIPKLEKKIREQRGSGDAN